jgi:hypothetical protein
MRRKRSEELPSSRKSVWYYPEMDDAARSEAQERNTFFESLQSHMLIEDIDVQVIPYVRLSEKEPFTVELVPASQEVEALLADALTSRDRGWHEELASSLADFVRECTQSVITAGEAVYEIVYSSNLSDQKVVAFHLEPIRAFTIKYRAGKYHQEIPEKTAERLGVSKRISLPADSILIFRLPRQVRKSVERTLQTLVVLSKKIMPEFAMNFAEAASKFHYDSSNQLYVQKLALADAGKAIGWNARGLVVDDMLEFYSLKSLLCFERFKIVVRNSIIDTLNEGLKLAGRRMGFEGQIRLHGLPELSDVERAKSELESGSKPFGEVLKPFLRN